MYYVPMVYQSPYYVENARHSLRSKWQEPQGTNRQVLEALLAGIKGEASTTDLYSRLAQIAPNQKNRNDLFQAAENKRRHVRELTSLYTAITGKKPVYQIEKDSFNNYQEGLEKAYEKEIKGEDAYQKSCLLTLHPFIQNTLARVLYENQAQTAQLGFLRDQADTRINDYGKEPFVVDIEEAVEENNNFRTAIWTGEHLQVTLMSIDVGDDIGLEVHPDVDQFLRIEEGQGLVQMGETEDQLDFEEEAFADYAIMVPAGMWHNLTNTGNQPLKLYTIYAPPEHPFGTVHETKAIAMAEEHH